MLLCDDNVNANVASAWNELVKPNLGCHALVIQL
jgi:hypothetical protein